MEKKLRKPKQKIEMKVRRTVCYAKTDLPPEEEGYSICFISSGFALIWLKVWECHDYTVGISYASREENAILNQIK